jgi:hypothetical protein
MVRDEHLRYRFAAVTTASFKAFNTPSRFSFGRPEMNVIRRAFGRRGRARRCPRPRHDHAAV